MAVAVVAVCDENDVITLDIIKSSSESYGVNTEYQNLFDLKSISNNTFKKFLVIFKTSENFAANYKLLIQSDAPLDTALLQSLQDFPSVPFDLTVSYNSLIDVYQINDLTALNLSNIMSGKPLTCTILFTFQTIPTNFFIKNRFTCNLKFLLF